MGCEFSVDARALPDIPKINQNYTLISSHQDEKTQNIFYIISDKIDKNSKFIL